MGDPTYEAIRARERAEVERERAGSEVTKTAIAAFIDFFNGHANFSITPPQAAGGKYDLFEIPRRGRHDCRAGGEAENDVKIEVPNHLVDNSFCLASNHTFAQDAVPGEILKRPQLIKVGNASGTTFTLQHQG